MGELPGVPYVRGVTGIADLMHRRAFHDAFVQPKIDAQREMMKQWNRTDNVDIMNPAVGGNRQLQLPPTVELPIIEKLLRERLGLF